MNLSPSQLHYFKRELIALQLKHELHDWRQTPNLASLLQSSDQETAFPFLYFIAQKFVIEFPLLKRGSHAEFWAKCQVFLDEFSKIKLDTYAPKQTSASQRRILMYKLQKTLVLALCASIRTVQGDSDFGGLASADAGNAGLVTAMEQQLTLLENSGSAQQSEKFNGWTIDIVTVREVTEKHKLRDKTFAEFIIQCHTSDYPHPIVVARRHSQFKQLCQDLRSDYTDIEIPSVPSKIKDHRKDLLYRDKDRLLLRAYLRRIASDPVLAKSERFRSFLTVGSTALTGEEKADAEKRRQDDEAKLAEEVVFRTQVDEQLAELQDILKELKQKVMQPGGLIQVFDKIKTTERLQDLPLSLQKAFEWGRINFAFTLHSQFITSDRASENLRTLKRTHTLMPYRAMSRLLKISNPFGMIKGVLDLFLAQPFGGRSLLQRIILSNMNDEIKEMQQDITELEAIIADPALCAKIKNAVETPLPKGTKITQDDTNYSGLLEMLNDATIEPQLTPGQIARVDTAVNNLRSEESKTFVKHLQRLWALSARKREHELLTTLVFQGNTGELIKDIFAIFYQPLAEVYKAANIGDSIHHLSAFVDDLVALLDSLDGQDVKNTTQPFIQLVQRHEDNFYSFVHNVHAKDTSHLFDELLGYVDNLFAFIAHGITGRIDLEAVVVSASVTDRMNELKQEIDALCEFHEQRKIQRMKRRRQKLMMNQTVEATPLDVSHNQSEVVNVLNELVDMENDAEEDGDELAHELTLKQPKLVVLPLIVPAFVQHVKIVMKQV